MKRKKDYTIAALLIPFAIAVLVNLPSCKKEDNGHKCKWELCPYKGATADNYKERIAEYTGEPDGSDAFIIDCLHIEYPTLEYDQLEELLFKNMKH